jgi:hypothetical protein
MRFRPLPSRGLQDNERPQTQLHTPRYRQHACFTTTCATKVSDNTRLRKGHAVSGAGHRSLRMHSDVDGPGPTGRRSTSPACHGEIASFATAGEINGPWRPGQGPPRPADRAAGMPVAACRAAKMCPVPLTVGRSPIMATRHTAFLGRFASPGQATMNRRAAPEGGLTSHPDPRIIAPGRRTTDDPCPSRHPPIETSPRQASVAEDRSP